MMSDFQTETEDESPREVSKELVALHNELLTGNSTTIQRLQKALPAALSSSQRQTVALFILLGNSQLLYCVSFWTLCMYHIQSLCD